MTSPAHDASAPSREGTARAAVFAMFLAALLLTWPGWRSLFDPEAMLGVTHALLFERTVMVPLPGGTERGPSVYGLGQSLVFVPAVVAAHVVPLPRGTSPEERELLFASLTNSVVVAAIAAVLFAAGRRFGLSPARALALSACGVLGTPLWLYTQFQMSEPITALCLLSAALGLSAAAGPRRQLLVGALFGVAVLARPVELVLLPALAAGFILDARWSGAPIARRDGARRALVLALGILPFGVLHLIYNAARFGSVLVTGYAAGANIAYRARDGIARGLELLVLSRRIGLVWFAPVAALGLLLLPLLWRRREPIGVVAAIAFALQALIHARSGVVWGGPFWGPRYLVPVMPLVLLGIVPLLARGGLALAVVLLVGALSVAMNLLGVAHNTVNTHHNLGARDDLISWQLARVSPPDLARASMHPASGTLWPDFTPFGVALLVAIALAALLFLRATGTLRGAHAAVLAGIPIVFIAARERSLPYRVLSTRSVPSVTETPLPLGEAVIQKGRPHESDKGLALYGRARADLTTRLTRGLHCFRLEVVSVGTGPAIVTLALGDDELARATLTPGESRTIVSVPLSVRHSRRYTLSLAVWPEREGEGRAAVVCTALALQSPADRDRR
ncbi:MAG: hypothetical protein U0166_17725 [Acidobacteriota bacterium]